MQLGLTGVPWSCVIHRALLQLYLEAEAPVLPQQLGGCVSTDLLTPSNTTLMMRGMPGRSTKKAGHPEAARLQRVSRAARLYVPVRRCRRCVSSQGVHRDR